MQKYVFLSLYIFFYIAIGTSAWAQCPQAAFTLPDTVCIGENLSIQNTSTGATRYEWDFCSGDLSEQPIVQKVTTLTGTNIPTGITLVNDGSNWYGFACNRNGSQIVRLDFGNSVDNIPTQTNLGNVGGILNFPNELKFRKEGGNWYALGINLFSPTNKLVRFNFGNSLTNIPSIVNIGNAASILNAPRGLDLVEDGEVLIAIVTDFNSNKVAIINFGNSITNNPAPADIKVTDPLPGSTNLMNVSVIKECDKWYAFVTAVNSKLYRLDFNSSLFSLPAVTDLSSVVTSISNTGRIRLVHTDRLIAFLLSLSGKLYQLDFDNDITNSLPLVSQINTANAFNDIDGFDLVSYQSITKAFIVDFNTKALVKLDFPNPCSSSFPLSTQSVPQNISYTEKGLKKVVLKAIDANNNVNFVTKAVFVRPQVLADFSVSNTCEGGLTKFSAGTSPTGNQIMAWQWDLGDGVPQTTPNAQFTFNSPGSKLVKLTVTDVCGMESSISKSVEIYNKSTANFSYTASPCSNQEIEFKDVSTVSNDNTMNWYWSFGNGETSTNKDPLYTYRQQGTYTVTLTITGKSGCTSSTSKVISVRSGTYVDFIVTKACFSYKTQFINQSKFDDNTSAISYVWEFGDGTTINTPSPEHTYTEPGQYQVKLTIQNNVGCIVSSIQIITIYPLPKANFSYSLACSGGEVTTFMDESSTSETNIDKWIWKFNDSANPELDTSTLPNPSYTFQNAGTYQVQLKVITKAGCTDSITQAITVIQSPKADFSSQANCLTKEVKFTDTMLQDASVTNWYWEFGDGTFSTERNPKHTYQKDTTYTVTLIVTSSSRCTNKVSKIIATQNTLSAAFTYQSIEGQPPLQVYFTNASSEDATSFEWDFGDGTRSTEREPSHLYSATGSYTVTLVVKNTSGCRQTITKQLTISAAGTLPGIVLESVVISVANNEALVLIHIRNNGNQPITQFQFKGIINNKPFTATSDLSVAPLVPGKTQMYSLYLPAAGSTFYTICLQAIDLSTNTFSNRLCNQTDNSFAVFDPYPNPSTNWASIPFMLPSDGQIDIEIINMEGKLIRKLVLPQSKEGFNEYVVQVEGLAKGIYFIHYRFAGNIKTRKLVIN